MSPLSAAATLRRVARLTGICLVGLLALAATASAATLVNDTGNHFVYTAAAGDLNYVTLTYAGAGTFELSDDGAASVDTTGSAGRCSAPDPTNAPNVVTCTGTVSGLAADLGDQDDTFWATNTQGLVPVNVSGGSGYDELNGSDAVDTLDGGGDDDTIAGYGGVDSISGGAGSDIIYDGPGADTVDGGSGDDVLEPEPTKDAGDSYNGGDGSDRINYSQRTTATTVNLATGTGNGESGENDTVANIENVAGSNTANNTITGNDSANDLYGGDGVDTIVGNGGDDLILGDIGNDVLSGGDGSDYLEGGDGVDQLNGGNDSDYLLGEDGADTLNGDAGDDEIDPGTHYTGSTPGSDGVDTIDGGAGSDWLDYWDRTAPVNIDLSGGGDGSTATTSNGQPGENDSIKNAENVNLGDGADTFTGNSLRNVVYDYGGAGDNISTLGGDDEIDTYDGAVDTDNCGDGNDVAYVDVAGQSNDPVSDNVTGCESVNPDYVPPTPVTTPAQPAITSAPPAPTTTSPPVTNTAPPPVVIKAGAFVANTQQSPKADTVSGSASIPADGTNLEVDLLYNGKLAKVTVVGKLVKKGLKKGVVPFTVKLNKKAAKLARKKGKKGLKLTVKVTIKPPTGTATVRQFKTTVKKGKAPTCAARSAGARAHAAC
jgi:hypothetical protein